MKYLTTAAALVAGAIVASQSAQGQTTANDLYMGFENQGGGGSADYIINLGSVSSLIGNTSIVDLSGDFSMSYFTSAGLQGTNSATVFGGVVGGSNGNNPSDIFMTELRSGGAGGTPSVPGSSTPAGLTRSQDNTAYSALTQIMAPGTGTGLLDSSRSWENYVAPTLSTSSFYGATGDNPDSQTALGTVVYEDLWGTSNSSGLGGAQPFVYEGYFTLNLTGGTPSLTFTSVAVPEPSTYLLSGTGGILLLLLRNRFRSKSA